MESIISYQIVCVFVYVCLFVCVFIRVHVCTRKHTCVEDPTCPRGELSWYVSLASKGKEIFSLN